MHGNLHSHPDMIEIVSKMELAAKFHKENVRLGTFFVNAGTMFISGGLSLVVVGAIILKAEKIRLAQDLA